MKLIIAIIKTFKLEEVQNDLNKIGIRTGEKETKAI